MKYWVKFVIENFFSLLMANWNIFGDHIIADDDDGGGGDENDAE